MQIRRLAAAAVTGLAAGALALAGTAQAGEERPLSVALDGDCEAVEIVFTNGSDHAFFGDVRVDGADGEPDEYSEDGIGEGPLADEPFGDRYRSVEIPAGETVTETVTFEEESGEHEVEAVVRRGPEQHWYVRWQAVTVDCGEPDPTDSEPLTIDVTLGDDCGAEIAYTNPNDFAFWGDYRIGDEQGTPDSDVGPATPSINDPGYPDDLQDTHDHGVAPDQELTQGDHAGELFGHQYNPVLIAPGDTRVVEVEVDETTEVQARVWRGPNQSVYVPWTDPVEVEPCEDPKPDPSETTDPGGGGGGQLPETSGVTGAVALPVAGAALLVAGGAALLVGRRRRLSDL